MVSSFESRGTVNDAAQSMLEAVPLPLVLVGRDARIKMANARAEVIFGRGLVQRHYITALRAPTIVEAIESVLLGREKTAEGLYIATQGPHDTSWRVVAASVGNLDDPSVLVSFEDVTALNEAGQIRRDFVANVSHELKTPLTALIGFIETLRSAAREDPAAQERFLDIMAREAGRMNRLVHDLLSLSRVEAVERMRPTDPVDIAALVRAVTQSLRPLADEAGVSVTAEGDDGMVTVPGDGDQLAQVLTNLVENAIKYSGRGSSVLISLGRIEHDPVLRGAGFTVSVADDGEGIDPVHVPRLTERFYRVDGHRSRQKGGTGLGLAIVKHIVNRHRGRLRIDSAPGRGSRFSVTLPTA